MPAAFIYSFGFLHIWFTFYHTSPLYPPLFPLPPTKPLTDTNKPPSLLLHLIRVACSHLISVCYIEENISSSPGAQKELLVAVHGGMGLYMCFWLMLLGFSLSLFFFYFLFCNTITIKVRSWACWYIHSNTEHSGGRGRQIWIQGRPGLYSEF